MYVIFDRLAFTDRGRVILLLKLRVFFRRLFDFDFHRMMMYVHAVQKDKYLPAIFIIADMFFCAAFYNVGFYDYYAFGFRFIKSHEQRKTFMTMQDNWKLSRILNDPNYVNVFQEKDIFNKRFTEFLGREYIDIREHDKETLRDFLKRHHIAFIKQPKNFGGLGVKRIDCTDIDLDNDDELEKIYNMIIEGKFFLVEECLKQHEDMNKLYPNSINTIRVVTVLDDNGKAHVMYTYVRMGVGGNYVDNVTSGGCYAMINPDGVITNPALCDKTGEFFTSHPDTHTVFNGFKIPYYNEVVELCKKAAHVEPHVRYIGWDVCVTPTGPVFVEGNYLPAYDGQVYKQLDNPGYGLKPVFQKIVPQL